VREGDVEHGFLVHPEEGTHPGVVLLPDVRGIYEHFRELGRRLAGEGFAVLVADLYRRTGRPTVTDASSAMRWIAELDDRIVLEEVRGSVDFLRGHPAVGGRRTGIMGFCMGGQYALLAACTLSGIAAAVSFYGMIRYAPDLDRSKKPRSPLEAARDLRCPLLGLYGAEDALIPLEDVRAFEEAARASGQPVEFRVYPEAGHAFLNDTQPERFRPEAAADAWRRAVAFLRARLGAGGGSGAPAFGRGC